MNLFKQHNCKSCNSPTDKIVCCFLPVTVCSNEECQEMTGKFTQIILLFTEISLFFGSEGFTVLVYQGPFSRAFINYLKVLF